MQIKLSHFVYLMFAQFAFMFVLFLYVTPKFSPNAIKQYCEGCEPVDVIAVASQMGRLDIVSLSLAFLGLGIGFFAIFSYFSVKEDAEKTAIEAADKRIDRTLGNKFDLLKMEFEQDFDEIRKRLDGLGGGPAPPDTAGSTEIPEET